MNLLLIGGAILLSLFIYLFFMFITRRQFILLSYILYQQNDPKTYLEKLNQFPTTFLFNRRLRELMKIDAYLALEDHEQLEAIFEQFNQKSMRSGDRFTLLTKEIAYYCQQNQPSKAKKAYEDLLTIKEKCPKHLRYEHQTDEMTYLIDVHVDKTGQYAKELIEKAKQTEGLASGVYYYRAAQSYAYQNKLDQTKKALEKAKKEFKNTRYASIIDKLDPAHLPVNL